MIYLFKRSKKITFPLILCLTVSIVSSQVLLDSLPIDKVETKSPPRTYPFVISDSYSSVSAMSLVTTNYASSMRLGFRAISDSKLTKKQKKTAALSLQLLQLFFFPYSHEEGHRSVLTTEDIGAIATSTYDIRGVAVVKGVTDKTLMALRDDKLSTYIRLHTGGLESDFLMVKQLRTILAFEEDNYENIFSELLLRNAGIVGYYFGSLLTTLEPKIVESSNELENDIVGHDVYGAIRNLHRPSGKFYRYTKYDDLIGDEKNYLNTVAYLSLFNVISPKWAKFKLPNNGKIAFGTGFTMTPFGYQIELDSWIKYRNIKCLLSLHSFQNRVQNNLGLGVNFYDIGLTKNVNLDIMGNVFQQPKNLDFNTNESFTGGFLETKLKIRLPKEWKIPLELHVSGKVKSYGFVLGEPYFREGIFLKLGGALIL